jgi:hypothetical protein
MRSVTRFLGRLPRLVLLLVGIPLAIIELFLVLMTVLLLDALLATGPDAVDERAENGIDWGLGLSSLILTAVLALLLFFLVRAYLRPARTKNRK